ncbi:O-acetyl-ADP-ribose deacetylase [Arsenicicoccus dermatophilus]|uniref:O-acetyl-ADP-ribose deacetylase n=1 Tax=Arsenicicoccus dermatophilus TaxID=1076331 RepID=UPI001F4D2DA1|nr:O-acetyl-ADP-ribose deacetylase [Arsenicicoccus dermatophilus]MCH8611831.1 O-acetyl-ADP-ribose deacetylase [Arsenicicoccus dermatophilus]
MAVIEIVQGDITEQAVDAIVNAANSSLMGGGGVDGAIHRAAGPSLREECRHVRATDLPDGLPVGEAVATSAGDLPCRYVIHTVGPNRHEGQIDPRLLASCYTRCLDVAQELGVRSIAFPAVSAGAYGWKVADVARIALEQVGRHPKNGIDLVRFVPFDPTSHDAFVAAQERLEAQG